MNNDSLTLEKLKRSLLEDLRELFPGNEAYSICRLILEHFDFPEFTVLKDPLIQIDEKIQSEIKKIVNELSKNKPIQYILGETIFFDLKLIVNESVLIPRQETEELVSKIILETRKSRPRILDIGCGSGCISIALARNIPGSKVYGMDVDSKVIELAKQNATVNETDVHFFLESIFEIASMPDATLLDIIVSNPPYLTRTESNFMLPNVLEYEPDLALFVPDEDPLVFYREIIRFAKTNLLKSGCIWTEINEKYGPDLRTLFLESGYSSVKIIKDIHEKDRFLKASYTNVRL